MYYDQKDPIYSRREAAMREKNKSYPTSAVIDMRK